MSQHTVDRNFQLVECRQLDERTAQRGHLRTNQPVRSTPLYPAQGSILLSSLFGRIASRHCLKREQLLTRESRREEYTNVAKRHQNRERTNTTTCPLTRPGACAYEEKQTNTLNETHRISLALGSASAGGLVSCADRVAIGSGTSGMLICAAL